MQRLARSLAGVSRGQRAVPLAAVAGSVPRAGARGYFEGISEKAEFTNKAEFRKAAEPIPIFRIMNEDAELIPGAELPFSNEEMLGMFKTMVRASQIDNVLNSLQRQGRISFYMTQTGEEAAGVGSCAGLRETDVIWPQYRELGAFLHRGFTIQQVTDQCLSRGCEPGRGRQMPVHYTDRDLHIQAVTSPLGTQLPQAVGAGYAFRIAGDDRCGVAYFGDGAASEGDFAVALNFAATLRSQCVFICRNNGWAISTPVKEQYAGDGIAVRGLAYGLQTIRVDGNDLAATFHATRLARDHCVEHGEPAIVELMTYRRSHHSTSDDSSKYREKAAVSAMAREGLEPLSRVRMWLTKHGVWDDAKHAELEASTREEVMQSLKISESKKLGPISAMFEDVFAEETPQLLRQKAELFEHLEKYGDKYDLAKYEQS